MTSNRITASGEAEVTAEPEVANVTVGITREHDDVGTIRKRLAERAEELRSALREYGLRRDAITTTSYGIHATRRTPEDNQDRPDHRGEHTFRVVVDDVERVGDVIDVALSSGATDLNNVEFTLSDETRRDCRDEAIANAVEEARHDATAAAAAESLALAGVNELSVDRARIAPSQPRGEAMALASVDDTAQTEIESGDVSVNASVTVEYALDDE